MEDTPQDDHDHHDEQLQNCLVDLHGWCIVLPFHREGLPFLAFTLAAFYQMTVLVKRMLARELHGPNPSALMEWHLLLGRVGFLFLIFGTMIENFRLWMGSFDVSWPLYVIDADNIAIANQRWIHNGGAGAAVQSFLFWYQSFFQAALTPIVLFSITYIFAKGVLLRSRRFQMRLRQIGSAKWFASSVALVTVVMVMGVFGFLVGPTQGPLELVRIYNIWSLTSVLKSPVGACSMVVWQHFLLLLALLLLLAQDSNRRLHNTLFVAINLVAVVVHWMAANSTVALLPPLAHLMEQIAIATQIWADVSHNEDDFGITDAQREAHRQPLLQEHRQQEHDQDEVDAEEGEAEEQEVDAEDDDDGEMNQERY